MGAAVWESRKVQVHTVVRGRPGSSQQGCMTSRDGSGSGFALEAPSFPATSMPASALLRPRPGHLRGGREGDSGEEDEDGTSTVGPLEPPHSGLTLCPRGPGVLSNQLSWLPRVPRAALAPRAWAEVGPWRLWGPELLDRSLSWN